MTIYTGNCNGAHVTINLDFSVASTQDAYKVNIRKFLVDDITLLPLDSSTFGSLEEIMTFPGNPGMGAKQAIWVPRGDQEDPSRCFIGFKGGNPLGYFNIGSSKVSINYQDHTFSPNESGGYIGKFEMPDFVKVVYASTCYYDLVKKANHDCFGSHVIYTTNDTNMREALINAGWSKSTSDNPFFQALTSVSPEIADGREGRFKEGENGAFLERSGLGRDDANNITSEFTAKDLLVHEIGSLLGLSEFSQEAAE